MILEDKLGSNPFKMGIVSGADSHSGYSNNEEFGFHGSHGALEDTPKKRLNPVVDAAGDIPARLGTAGTTAVWAEENTRTSIFDAMKSKETYGTSGTLIRLRFFGGWGFDDGLVKDKDFVVKAYKDGVPMGQDLPDINGKAPTFAVWAQKILKAATSTASRSSRVSSINGAARDEKIYDVALSDERKADKKTGKIPPVGNTVDVKKATYTNDIGDTQLSTVWTDPDFDAKQKAVYYVRVLEIPTPRWSTYDSVRSGLPIPESIPPTIQERAWSSPIWYTPEVAKK